MKIPKIAVIGGAGMGAYFSVEHFHVDGETLEAWDFHLEPGGKGFNQAVAAKRYGAEVSFLAATGDDDYGRQCREFLEKEGIKCPLAVKPGKKTTFAVIITDKKGQNQVTEYLSVYLNPQDVIDFEKEISNADILLLQNEVPDDVNIEAIRIAEKHNVKIIYNPAPGKALPAELLRDNILYTPNEHEIQFLPEILSQVIVTLGSKGCLIKSTGKTVPSTSHKPVNTTGAGDTFNGVLAASLASGILLEDACILANHAAGISVTRNYAVSSIPFKSEYYDK